MQHQTLAPNYMIYPSTTEGSERRNRWAIVGSAKIA
jgi:hypothetical protein